jgi:dipeptide/tripeptide permease
MIVLGVVCFVGACAVPVIGGWLMDEQDKVGSMGTSMGIYFSSAILTVGLIFLSIRCVLGHW